MKQWNNITSLDEKYKHLWLDLNTQIIKNRHIIRLDIKEGEVLVKYCNKANERIVEIGRKRGGSTWLITESTTTPVISIDKDTKKLKVFLERYIKTKQLTLINKLSEDVKLKYKYDVLFIDGDHTYEGVKKDIINFWNNLTLNGYAIFHDYIAGSDVKRAVDELLIETKKGKIKEYVNSLLVVQKINEIN